jgi:SprA family protein
MIQPILASLSSVGQLYQLARPFEGDRASGNTASGEALGATLPLAARARAVADQVEISPRARQAAATADGPDGTSPADDPEVQDLRQRDREVRAHEAAHKAAAGQYGGSVNYTYETGPDGKRYAVGGSVDIDVSPIPGDPQATIRKMEIVMRAAQAPDDPSPQDRMVAQATRQLEHAQQQISSSVADGGASVPSGKSCSSSMKNPYQSSGASAVSSMIDTCA